MDRRHILTPLRTLVALVVVTLGTQSCAPPQTPTTTSVTGMVWVDTNGDGLRDPGEKGLPGVTIGLLAGADLQSAGSTKTGPDGMYAFDGVEQSVFRVTTALPSGYAFTLKDQGTDDRIDSDVNPSGSLAGQTDSFVPGVNNRDHWDSGLIGALPVTTATPLEATALPPATGEPPTLEPLTQVAGDYQVLYYVAIDSGQNAPLVNLPPTGTMHVAQSGQRLTMEIEGADPSQTHITFDATLVGLGTATAVASSLVAGIPDVITQIAGGFLRTESGEIQVSFTLEIGVNGELPGGQTVVYSVVSE